MPRTDPRCTFGTARRPTLGSSVLPAISRSQACPPGRRGLLLSWRSDHVNRQGKNAALASRSQQAVTARRPLPGAVAAAPPSSLPRAFGTTHGCRALLTPRSERRMAAACCLRDSKGAVGELGTGLVHRVLDLLVLPEVDELGQAVQQDDAVPAEHKCTRRGSASDIAPFPTAAFTVFAPHGWAWKRACRVCMPLYGLAVKGPAVARPHGSCGRSVAFGRAGRLPATHVWHAAVQPQRPCP